MTIFLLVLKIWFGMKSPNYVSYKKKWLLDVKIAKWNDYKRHLEAIIVLYHGSFKILIVILDVKIGADSFRIKKKKEKKTFVPQYVPILSLKRLWLIQSLVKK